MPAEKEAGDPAVATAQMGKILFVKWKICGGNFSVGKVFKVEKVGKKSAGVEKGYVN